MRYAIMLALCVLAACGRNELLASSPAGTGGSFSDAWGGSSSSGGGWTASGGTGDGGTSASGGIVNGGSSGGNGGAGGTTVTSATQASGGVVSGGGAGGTKGGGGALSSGGAGGHGGAGGTTMAGGTMAAGGAKSTGGVVGIGGMSTGGGGGSSCTSFAPCAGNLVGTWTVKTSCLWVIGQLDLAPLGLDCSFAQVTGSLQVSGTWAAKSDGIQGAYADNTTTWSREQLTLPASCLSASGTATTCDRVAPLIQSLGYAQVSCTSSAGGGCACTADVKQAGGMGFWSADPQTSGQFRTSGGLLSTDGGTRYWYCSSGNTLTFSPLSEGPSTTGSIVLQQ